MNILIIREYIKKMTKNDLNNIFQNQDIYLNETELNNVYHYIKENYNLFLQKKLKIETVMKDARNLVSITNYNKMVNIYLKYKDKI